MSLKRLMRTEPTAKICIAEHEAEQAEHKKTTIPEDRQRLASSGVGGQAPLHLPVLSHQNSLGHAGPIPAGTLLPCEQQPDTGQAPQLLPLYPGRCTAAECGFSKHMDTSPCQLPMSGESFTQAKAAWLPAHQSAQREQRRTRPHQDISSSKNRAAVKVPQQLMALTSSPSFSRNCLSLFSDGRDSDHLDYPLLSLGRKLFRSTLAAAANMIYEVSAGAWSCNQRKTKPQPLTMTSKPQRRPALSWFGLAWPSVQDKGAK